MRKLVLLRTLQNESDDDEDDDFDFDDEDSDDDDDDSSSHEEDAVSMTIFCTFKESNVLIRKLFLLQASKKTPAMKAIVKSINDDEGKI